MGSSQSSIHESNITEIFSVNVAFDSFVKYTLLSELTSERIKKPNTRKQCTHQDNSRQLRSPNIIEAPPSQKNNGETP